MVAYQTYMSLTEYAHIRIYTINIDNDDVDYLSACSWHILVGNLLVHDNS